MAKPGVEMGARLIAFLTKKMQCDVDALAKLLSLRAGRPVAAKKLYFLSQKESLAKLWVLEELYKEALLQGWEPADDFEKECLSLTIQDPADFMQLTADSELVQKIESYKID